MPVKATIVVRPPSPIGYSPGVLTGDPAPGMAAGDTFVDFDDKVGTIDKDGRVGFVGSVDGPSGPQSGVWAGPLGALGAVATTLDNVPGEALPFNSMRTPGHDGTGKVVFYGGGGTGSGIFSTQTGPLERVVFQGDQLPGEPGGSAVYQLGDEARMNGASEVLMRAFAQDGDGAGLPTGGQ